MSTYFGYVCVECRDTSPMWLNHGEETLRAIKDKWDIIKPVWDFAQQNGYLELRMEGIYTSPTPLEFLSVHHGHVVEIVNEYGKVSD